MHACTHAASITIVRMRSCPIFMLLITFPRTLLLDSLLPAARRPGLFRLVFLLPSCDNALGQLPGRTEGARGTPEQKQEAAHTHLLAEGIVCRQRRVQGPCSHQIRTFCAFSQIFRRRHQPRRRRPLRPLAAAAGSPSPTASASTCVRVSA